MPNQKRVESVMIWGVLSLIILSLMFATIFEFSFEKEVIAIASIISYSLIPYIMTKTGGVMHRSPCIVYLSVVLGSCLFITWLLYIFIVQLQIMFYVFMVSTLSYALTDLLLLKHRNYEWAGVISILIWISFMR